MAKELIFYTNPMSRGQIIRWMLEETGAAYQQELIEYGEQIKSAEYLAINPMGKIPAIKHGEYIVTECAAICAYLADAFPDANLAPDLSNRADYYRWLFFAAGPLESAITNKSLGVEPSDDQQRMAGYGNYDLVVSVLDQLLGGRNYICGDTFTAADVYVGSQIDFGLQFKTLEPTDNFSAYAERMRARDAYQAAKKIDIALMPSS
jgi:glutathione S-transferase